MNTFEVSSPTNRKDHPERSGFFFVQEIGRPKVAGNVVWQCLSRLESEDRKNLFGICQ